MLSAAIIGGTGYTGKYLIKFLENHPYITDYQVYGNKTAGTELNELFPELSGLIGNQIVASVKNISINHDIYFIALPHGKSTEFVPSLLTMNKKIIDLGGDYRLNSNDLYREWYNFSHADESILQNKNYGLADKYKYYNFDLISNPGCYPTSALTALLPLMEFHSEKIRSVDIVSYSGTSGAGKSAKIELSMSEMDGNVKAYNVQSHRHEPEILQELEKAGFDSSFSFTTHLLPISRGIYSTSIVHLDSSVSQEDLEKIYQNEYSDSEFVRLRKIPPSLNWVTETNFCDINISAKAETIIITSAIDNLIKGASGQAVQNMNKLFGWNESLGIKEQNIEYDISNKSTLLQEGYNVEVH